MTDKPTQADRDAELRADILMKQQISARQKLNYVPVNFADVDTILAALSRQPDQSLEKLERVKEALDIGLAALLVLQNKDPDASDGIWQDKIDKVDEALAMLEEG